MGGRAEELLYLLLWVADHICNPRMRHVGESFETWAWREGYLRSIQRLESRRLVSQTSTPEGRPHLQITPEGRTLILGGRDPEIRWRRSWDGRWRLVVFDLPQEHDSRRKSLRRLLRSRGCGCFQKSVWITPDPIDALLPEFQHLESNPCRLTVLEAQTLEPYRSPAVVASSWDFLEINQAYQRHLDVLRESDSLRVPVHPADRALRVWMHQEQRAWMDAVGIDPLLPEALLPPGYLGKVAWAQRQRVLSSLTSGQGP